MQNGIVLPEWDYEWIYNVDDCYPSQKGWTKAVSGTGKEQKTSSGYYQMYANKTNDYIMYSWPNTYSKGVLRLQFRLASGGGSGLRIYLSNGTTALGVRANYNSQSTQRKFYLINGADYSTMTSLATFKNQNTYYLELILDNGYGDVRMRDYTGSGDWQTIASHVDCSTIVSQASMGTETTRMKMSSFTNSAQAWTIYRIQMKFGRT